MVLSFARQTDGVMGWQRRIASFRGLDLDDPSQWPLLPRRFLLGAVFVLVVLVLWLLGSAAAAGSMAGEQALQAQLKSEYRQKLRQVASQAALKQHIGQLQQRVAQLERQLPSKADQDALLSGIHQAGLQQGLHFELLRPAPETTTGQHVEWPVALRVTGTFHGIAQFAAEIAQLNHPVVLHRLHLASAKDRPGLLTLECIARTVRLQEPTDGAIPASLPGVKK